MNIGDRVEAQSSTFSELIMLHIKFKGTTYTVTWTQICAAIFKSFIKQVAQWATIAHLGASIMFGDTLIDDAQRQVTLNLKQ